MSKTYSTNYIETEKVLSNLAEFYTKSDEHTFLNVYPEILNHLDKKKYRILGDTAIQYLRHTVHAQILDLNIHLLKNKTLSADSNGFLGELQKQYSNDNISYIEEGVTSLMLFSSAYKSILEAYMADVQRLEPYFS